MSTTPEMAFSVETTGPCRKKVSVTIPSELVSEEFDKTYRNLIKTVPIQGFRPGKAPRGLVEKRYGPQVAAEVKQTLLDSAYERALKDNEIAPISAPDVENITDLEAKPATELAFAFTVTVKPEFELPDIKGIEVSVPPAVASPEEIEVEIDGLRRRKATLRPTKAKIANGDVVTLDARGTDGETELFHSEDLVYEVGTKFLGGLITDDMDDALLGQKPEAGVEAKAYASPHEANHPLHGVDVQVSAKILEVKRPELPEVDEEFAKSLDFDSVDELKETIEKDVQSRRERERDKQIENLALEQLIEKSEFELPEEMIAAEVDELAARAAYQLQQEGKSEEEIAQKVAELKAARKEESEAELRRFFVLDKIVEKERVLVTESEVKSAVAMIAAYNQTSPEEMYAQLRESGRLGTLRNQLRETKAREKLRKKVTVKDAAAPKAKKKASKKKAAKKKD
ncbi:MAG: trigger factor [Planctomycetota bacterium]|jgi:trigger factor